jgi:hypothetical protein
VGDRPVGGEFHARDLAQEDAEDGMFARLDGATIWIRLPASERAAYQEFGEAPETALPKKAVLLIGHNGEFEKLFDDAEDDDQLVQSRGYRHLPRRQVGYRPARQRSRHIRGR